MPRAKYIPDGSESVHFDLDDTVKNNFNKYQHAVERYPESFSVLKLRYDQYLKTLSVYRREQEKETCMTEPPKFVFEDDLEESAE
uniref:Uncharacterized protein n=1 Tax=Candidatus Kentrum sp. SD TaxID=2126332 RepID=A0A450YMB3_9GAMM|nr:MAG: hypothetical protein BECKSD772F_GA0070984_11264 [Candidatus Kentron sp. SD]VFK49659.1 MAG: hypothetical protein BECKSD772E_GA0070983_12112 [Candidatus Kentron sp. SD]VFK81184.1 MAG: hypothetical protein BECKSD772D_GA0070982_12472 [Candidatus Kentron sp. SD]